jgi:hypothetical protein
MATVQKAKTTARWSYLVRIMDPYLDREPS